MLVQKPDSPQTSSPNHSSETTKITTTSLTVIPTKQQPEILVCPDDLIPQKKAESEPQKVCASIKPIVKTKKEDQQKLHREMRQQLKMGMVIQDHGSEEGCKVLKGKRIEFIMHNKKKQYVFIQFQETYQDANSEKKMINMLYKRLDLTKPKFEDDKSFQSDETSDDIDRQVLFSEESLNTAQQETALQVEQIFPNFINENSFVFKKKSVPQGGLVLDQVVYSDRIIKYIGYDIQEFQIVASQGTPTLLKGRESFYQMMRSVQKQANQYLKDENSEILPKDIVTLLLKSKKNVLIQAECGIECRLVEGSFYVKIDVIKTINANYDFVDDEKPTQEFESTARKLEQLSPDQQDFIKKYINQIPENELEHNKNKICGFKFISKKHKDQYEVYQDQYTKNIPKKKTSKKTKKNQQQQQKQEQQQKQPEIQNVDFSDSSDIEENNVKKNTNEQKREPIPEPVKKIKVNPEAISSYEQQQLEQMKQMQQMQQQIQQQKLLLQQKQKQESQLQQQNQQQQNTTTTQNQNQLQEQQSIQIAQSQNEQQQQQQQQQTMGIITIPENHEDEDEEL